MMPPDERLERVERKAVLLADKVTSVDRLLLEHVTQSTGRWGEQRRGNERMEAQMKKHEDRIDKLESWRDKAGVKLAVIVATATFLASIVASVVVRALVP